MVEDNEMFGKVVFTSQVKLGSPENPEDFITNFEGKIHSSLDDILETNYKEVEVGVISGKIIEIEKARNYKFPVNEVFDVTGEVDEYMAQVWDYSSGDYSETINPNDEYLGDILLIDTIYIYPKFNGHGLGLAAIRSTIEYFKREGLVVLLRAHPLQLQSESWGGDNFKQKMNMSKFESNEDKALKSLRKYYSKAGFNLIKDTWYMFRLELGLYEKFVNGKIIE
jgi:GNAT superfamily N-acetyltransferase